MSRTNQEMDKKPIFQIQATNRFSEKGHEYILYCKHTLPSSFMKYFDIALISFIEINLNNKRQISLFILNNVSQEEVNQKVAKCCEKLLDEHYVFIDEIHGPMLMEKQTSNPPEQMFQGINFLNLRVERSDEEILKDYKIRLKKAIANEDYMVAAGLRDKIQSLIDGEKTSK